MVASSPEHMACTAGFENTLRAFVNERVDAEGLDLGCDAGGQARLRLVEMLVQRLTGLVDVGAEVVLDDNNRDPLVRVGRQLLNTGDALDTLLQRIGDIMLDDGGRCPGIHRHNRNGGEIQ